MLLGCRAAVSSAISWFFEHVEEGNILEDDCLPDQSFFPFCRKLLEKYRHDDRVMQITGDNFQCGRTVGPASYYASQCCHIWGWAGWRRVWKLYDPDMRDYPDFVRQGGFEKVFRFRYMRQYYRVIFDRVYQAKLDTWDHQLAYTILKNNGLCIVPNVNLVENIGFTSGTHISFNQFSFFKVTFEPDARDPRQFVRSQPGATALDRPGVSKHLWIDVPEVNGPGGHEMPGLQDCKFQDWDRVLAQYASGRPP